MADILYNQGGVTIDSNGVRRYADGSSDKVDPSMVRGLSSQSNGSGSLGGINFNGGLVKPAPNYSNANDPFSVGYGTPSQSAGTGNASQASTKPMATATPSSQSNQFTVGGGNVDSQGHFSSNTKPMAFPSAGLIGGVVGAPGVSAYQGGGIYGQMPSAGNNAPANPGLTAGFNGNNVGVSAAGNGSLTSGQFQVGGGNAVQANTNPTTNNSNGNQFVIGGGNVGQPSQWTGNTNPTASTVGGDPFVIGGGNVGAAPNGVTSGVNKPLQVPTPGQLGAQAGAGNGIIGSAITPWNITADQTVAGNIEGILSGDSPLLQQARTRAMQQMGSRGLINSSLAASAADSAMYDVANTIAQADAATKAKAVGYNADQLNQQVTLDKQLANQMSQAQLSADTSRYSTDTQARTAALNNESQRMLAQMNDQQQVTLQRMQQDNQTLLNTNQQAAAAFNNSMQYIDVINRDPNLDGPAKTRAIAQIYYNLQTQLRTLSQVSSVDVTGSLSLSNAPGFDENGNFVGFDENGNTIGRPTDKPDTGASNSASNPTGTNVERPSVNFGDGN